MGGGGQGAPSWSMALSPLPQSARARLMSVLLGVWASPPWGAEPCRHMRTPNTCAHTVQAHACAEPRRRLVRGPGWDGRELPPEVIPEGKAGPGAGQGSRPAERQPWGCSRQQLLTKWGEKWGAALPVEWTLSPARQPLSPAPRDLLSGPQATGVQPGLQAPLQPPVSSLRRSHPSLGVEGGPLPEPKRLRARATQELGACPLCQPTLRPAAGLATSWLIVAAERRPRGAPGGCSVPPGWPGAGAVWCL